MGCTHNTPLSSTISSRTSAENFPEIFRPVSDIPIPKDAELDPNQSLILSGSKNWTGRVVMSSSISANEAFNFFKTEMLRYEWLPIMTVQSAVSVLSFTNNDRAATVQIEGRALGGSRIMVTIAPSQNSTSDSTKSIQSRLETNTGIGKIQTELQKELN